MSRHETDPFNKRSSGVLLHPTSLPSPHGVGDLGPAAYEFVDFLEAAGQSWWQMLPVGPPGAGYSPYDSPSAFAGSPLLISLEHLQRQGLLEKSELRAPKTLASAKRATYAKASQFRESRLRIAHQRFEADANPEQKGAFEAFNQRMAHWLDSYSAFIAIKHESGESGWFEWEPGLRLRKARALRDAERRLAPEIGYARFQQFLFDQQWQALKRYCEEKGVRLLGDIPMFVAHDGADVWEHQDLFFLDEDGNRTSLAGVPPDYFSADGQLWGNPLYRWSTMKRSGYAWWLARLEHTLSRFDALRLDHFIAFHRYWEIPGDATSAKEGRFVKVPGKDFFRKVKKKLGTLPFVAEDLGLVTPKVQQLRDHFELPGMRVLQFGFSEGAQIYQPHNYLPRSVVYTGTHDNDTLVGWLSARGSTREQDRQMQKERERARAYVGATRKECHWDMVRTLLMSVANTTIFPLQDLLGLNSEARMNVPGTATGNWVWRVQAEMLTAELAKQLHDACELYERLPER